MSAIRPATCKQQDALHLALFHLRAARDELVVADCPRSVEKLRALIKSAEGAERHMRHRLQRSDRA
jgi:hypothetical protein